MGLSKTFQIETVIVLLLVIQVNTGGFVKSETTKAILYYGYKSKNFILHYML